MPPMTRALATVSTTSAATVGEVIDFRDVFDLRVTLGIIWHATAGRLSGEVPINGRSADAERFSDLAIDMPSLNTHVLKTDEG
ncbi:hypothetical protein [Rhodococcus sp. IEGM 1318]|uniref:hypothetical protein n=1 Tax=Rhodococcus sp. IEGM 1318 TaxID=3082226 RepID=UPI0029541CCA|nr:hypothetical protein [Rhodococcus sp. IEGM 1318]MDV8005776.1 hypothetical protein [Rhodococcus sp. IEGM 1318]